LPASFNAAWPWNEAAVEPGVPPEKIKLAEASHNHDLSNWVISAGMGNWWRRQSGLFWHCPFSPMVALGSRRAAAKTVPLEIVRV